MRGSEFRSLREKAKLTQQQTATALGVAVSTVFRWEGLETVPMAMGYALLWITKEASSLETAQEKAARETAKRKSTEAAWAAMPPWDDNERQRRVRLGLPMHDGTDGVDVKAETDRLFEQYDKSCNNS
jgi:transcriptional regulator with XRE-family HTH domain